MLISYGARNYFCFKEGVEISFQLGKSCQEDLETAHVLCVKGANGAGKSNTLRILHFLRLFCCDSFSLKPDEEINLKTFFGNSDNTDFFINFKDKGICYNYELTVNKNEVVKEVFTRKDKRLTKVFERNMNSVEAIKDFEDLKEIKLRSNASIISTAFQYEYRPLNLLYNFFTLIFPYINAVPFGHTRNEFESVSKYYFDNQRIFDFTKELLKKCDLGIKDIVIEEVEIDDENKKYMPYFIHDNSGDEYRIPYSFESSGTKSLFNQLFAYKITLDIGGILVLDEFDINLHPDILPLLISLFRDTSINENGAQLLFTTHNSEILNDLGKYRTILVNKDENESFLYRLDELPGDIIRNDRPLEPIYRSGRIRGVPRV